MNDLKQHIAEISSTMGTEGNPIKIMFGNNNDKNICQVMDLMYADLFDLPDGKSVIAKVINEKDGKYTYVYSPALPKDELELYCKNNFEAYAIIAEKHGIELEKIGAINMPQDFPKTDYIQQKLG